MPISKPNPNRTRPARVRQAPSANPTKEFGEGNYQATREYNRATRRFVQSGKVEGAARAAAPANEAEARDLEAAEKTGRDKRKEEDPALLRDYRKRNRA